MPQTWFQRLVFSILMLFVMVYVMVTYNAMLDERGLQSSMLVQSLLGMWPFFIASFFAERLIATPAAGRIAHRIVAGTNRPVVKMMCRPMLMVCFMASSMTLFSSVFLHGFVPQILRLWMVALKREFPFAMCVQLLFAGPLVRFLFSKLFVNQIDDLQANDAPVMVGLQSDALSETT